MGEFDDFPVKPKFQRGDRVYYHVLIIEQRGGKCEKVQKRLTGTIRNIRAKVQIEDVRPKTKTEWRKKVAGKLVNPEPLVTYAYNVGFEGELIISELISEADLFHANPLLRLVDET